MRRASSICACALALLACKPAPTVEPEPEPAPIDDDAPEPEPEPEPDTEPEPEVAAPTRAEDLDAATREKLSATIREHLDELQLCYEDQLRKDKSLAGKMTYTITIQPSGAVSAVAIDLDEVGSEAVRGCAVTKIEAWTFISAGLDEAADVTFSVDFTAV